MVEEFKLPKMEVSRQFYDSSVLYYEKTPNSIEHKWHEKTGRDKSMKHGTTFFIDDEKERIKKLIWSQESNL